MLKAMTIPEPVQKFKGVGRELLIPAIVVLVGVSCFALGRLSAPKEGSGLTIYYPPNYAALMGQSNANVASVAGSNIVVASKLGSKYFYPDCSGAKSISEANKITFASPDEAKKAGYAPAANCKGLQ